MLALVLTEHPLSAKHYLPEYILKDSIQETIDPIPVTSYDQLLAALKDYRPRIVLVFAAGISKIAYEWIPEVLTYLDHTQNLFIIPKSEKDEYLLQIVLQDLLDKSLEKSLSTIQILGHNLVNQQVARQIESVCGYAQFEKDSTQKKGHVITLTGSGASGVSTLALYYVPFIAERRPDLRVLLVDMNEGMRDLAVSTRSQHYRLEYYVAQLQNNTPFEIAVQTPYPKLPNLFSFSAVQDHRLWTANEISHFLSVAREQFDLIFIERGKADWRGNEMEQLKNDTDELVFIVRADSFSLDRTKRFTSTLKQYKAKVIVSHYDSAYISESEISQYLGLPVMGVFPFQRNLIPIVTKVDCYQPNKKLIAAFSKFKWETEHLDASKLKGKKGNRFPLVSGWFA